MEPVSQDFEQLPLARTSFPAALVGQYRIYSDHKNFTLVQADSAVNALESCGLTSVFKIEREAAYKNALIAPNFPAAASAAQPAADSVAGAA